MESIFYTGIDQHKRTSTLVTVDAAGEIVQQAKLKNNPDRILDYFATLTGPHHATVEATSGWYWLDELLTGAGIELTLAPPP